MRKFTREIAALLTSVAVSSGASAGTAFAETDEPIKTAGVAINTDLIDEPGTTTTTTTTTIPPLSGTMTGTTTTTTVTVPPLEGTMTGTTTATTTIPPLSGTMTGTTTTVTTTIPPLSGTMTGTTTTVTTTIPPLEGTMTGTTTAVTTTLPPFAGVMMPPADGDVNGDGSFGISDVVTFQKFLLNSDEGKLSNRYAADMNLDGELDVFDLIAMKRELVSRNGYYLSPMITSTDIIELSKKGDDITWDDLKDFRSIGGIGTGGYVYRYQLGDMNDRFVLFVTVDNDVIKSAALEAVSDSDRVDIRNGDVEAFIAKHNPPA